MRLLGFDYGTKRIGVALGDTEIKIASPLFTLNENEEFWNTVKKLISDEEIKEIVVGLPVSLSEKTGILGETEKQVMNFVKNLQVKFQITVHIEDERFSTDLATRLVGTKGKDRDAVAASIILQSYLDKI